MIKSPLKNNRKKYQKLSSHSDSELINVNRSSCSCGQNSNEINFNLLSNIGDSSNKVKLKYSKCLKIKDEVKIDLRKTENVSPVSSNRSIFRIYPIEELSENESFTMRSNKIRIKQEQTDQINRILELSKQRAKLRPIRNYNNSQQDNVYIRTVPFMKHQTFEADNSDSDKKSVKFDASSQTGSLMSHSYSPLDQTASNEVIEISNNFNNPNNWRSSSSFNSFNNNISNYTQDESVSSRSCLSFRKLFSCAFLQKSSTRKYHNK